MLLLGTTSSSCAPPTIINAHLSRSHNFTTLFIAWAVVMNVTVLWLFGNPRRLFGSFTMLIMIHFCLC